jgi:HD-like signal output (HDOD) protein
LTGDDTVASADKLANVILRDFALTRKLLKLVNSAFYGTRNAEITNISQAIVFLGVEQVRMTANSLTFFGHMKSDSSVLKDSMTKSFLCGLITRHLAQMNKMRAAEEAFICGMCQNLGENLAIYYFADDYSDIVELQRSRDLDKAAASRGVLGVSFQELGATVAQSWHLPGSIVEAIRGLPPGPVGKPANDVDKLRDIAVFANELSDLFLQFEIDELAAEFDKLLKKFSPSISLELDYCAQMLNAAFEKMKQYAPIFEINFATSKYCKSVQGWLNLQAAASQAKPSATRGQQRASN